MDERTQGRQNSVSKGTEVSRISVLRKGKSMELDGSMFSGEDGMASR